MKVENITSHNGNKVANQFIISRVDELEGHRIKEFQSYNYVIARITYQITKNIIIELDEKYWNHSVTTGKYRNIFLGETKKETQEKIKNGEYILTNLN